MSRRGSLFIALGASVFLISSAGAEDNAQFRTAVSVTGGLSVGSEDSVGGDLGRRFGFGHDGGDAGFAVGGGIARDVTPRLTIEANGAYLNRNSGGWSADAGFRLNLVPASHELVPYFAVSGGAIGVDSRRLDDLAVPYVDPRLQPGRGNPEPGRPGSAMPFVTAVMTAIPNFVSGGHSTNGMLTMGGGVRFDAGPHVFVRPDARAQLVFSNNTRVLGLFTLNFGYRF